MGITDYMTVGELKSFLSIHPEVKLSGSVSVMLERFEKDNQVIWVTKNFNSKEITSIIPVTANELYGLVV